MKTLHVVGLAAVLALAGGPLGYADEANKLDKLDKSVQDAILMLKKTDSKLQRLFDMARGYVVFPAVAKGAIGIGAAHDRGEVFENGKLIGTAEFTQVTIGPQMGGQKYAEVIFFENEKTLNAFKRGELTMSADASAVAAAEGAAAHAKYERGVLIYSSETGGLMFEASIGGQSFHFVPLEWQ